MRRRQRPANSVSSVLIGLAVLLVVAGLLLRSLGTPVQAAFGIANPTQEEAMLWPLLPGESIQQLAAKLYPSSPVLQQRFVQQTLRLSRNRGLLLTADQTARNAQLVVVPNAQALHTITHRIKKAHEVDPQTFVTPGLLLSVQLTSPATATHPGPLHALDLARWRSSLAKLFALPQAWHPWLQSARALPSQWLANYHANRQALARTPLHQLPQRPQLALIIASAIGVLLLSVLWGIAERRQDQH